MNITRLFVIVFLFLALTSRAQTDSLRQAEENTISVDVRHFDSEKVDKLKADTDLSYERGPAAVSLWQRFKMWLGRILNSLLETAVTTDWTRVLIYVVCGVVIVYVILRLLRIDALQMLYSGGDKGRMISSALEEDIHAMDFEKLIQEAIRKGEHRLAIRLIFLYSLRLLSDGHHIHWVPGKTNHDYMDELTSKDLKVGFSELNFYFEYAWYGNFAIREETFNRVNTIFTEWRARVNG